MASDTTVQSLVRAFELLEQLAASDGQASVGALARATGQPAPTAHRLLRTMLAAGYVRQLPDRNYALGPGLVRLGSRAHNLLGLWARPVLTSVVEQLGETANLAMFDQDRVVYVAQVPSPHAMRMFTEVGRRVLPHCTGVGKALLARWPEQDVLTLLQHTGLPAQTPRTITTPEAFVRELARVRRRGYALDDGEQEVGVRCIAVPLAEGRAQLAVSISGPAVRLPNEAIERAVHVLHKAAADLVTELSA